jgi:hypothetical protein
MQRVPSVVWIAIMGVVIGVVQDLYGASPQVLAMCGGAFAILKIFETWLTKPVVPVEPVAGTSFARSASDGAVQQRVPGFIERVLFAG